MAENVQRKNLLPSEMVKIAKQLRSQVEMVVKRGRPKKYGKLPEFKGEETRQIIAGQLNIGYKTLKKAEEIVDSGDQELIDEMDRSTTVESRGQGLPASARLNFL